MKQNFKAVRKDLIRDWQLYGFLLLPLAYILLFAYVPMSGLAIAFEDFNSRKGIFGSDWVGLQNFIKFFQSYQFERVLLNTVRLSLYTILAGFPVPVLFALFLNSLQSEGFKKVVQTIVSLPHFISVTVLVGILFQVFHSRTGLYGALWMELFGQYPKDLFGSPTAFQHLYVWSGVWQSFGWGSIIYIAALANVPPEYHEAAQIDGASRFQRVVHVDLPTIMPSIITMLILRMGSVMNLGYEKIYLMQNDLNISASEVISTYVYRTGLVQNDFSFSTAAGLFNSVVNSTILITANIISKKVGKIGLW